jgi:hypothetical protein
MKRKDFLFKFLALATVFVFGKAIAISPQIKAFLNEPLVCALITDENLKTEYAAQLKGFGERLRVKYEESDKRPEDKYFFNNIIALAVSLSMQGSSTKDEMLVAFKLLANRRVNYFDLALNLVLGKGKIRNFDGTKVAVRAHPFYRFCYRLVIIEGKSSIQPHFPFSTDWDEIVRNTSFYTTTEPDRSIVDFVKEISDEELEAIFRALSLEDLLQVFICLYFYHIEDSSLLNRHVPRYAGVLTRDVILAFLYIRYAEAVRSRTGGRASAAAPTPPSSQDSSFGRCAAGAAAAGYAGLATAGGCAADDLARTSSAGSASAASLASDVSMTSCGRRRERLSRVSHRTLPDSQASGSGASRASQLIIPDSQEPAQEEDGPVIPATQEMDLG